jgi:hypothetical protein
MSPNEDKDIFAIAKFLGLRNTVSEESFEVGDLAVATNVDQTEAFRLRRRKGYSATSLTASYHSIWASDDGEIGLAVTGSSLMELLPDLTARAVRSDLTLGMRMRYARMGSRVFYSNTVETGIFENGKSRSWGLATPTRLPLVALIGGSVPAGLYQFGLVYVRVDGQESGTGSIGSMSLSAPGGFQFRDIPVSGDPQVVFKHLYISPVNGDAMYRLLTLSNSTTEATYTTPRPGALPLATQFLSPALPGQHVSVFHGHTLIGRGSVLYRSEPYAPELFDLRKGLPFSDPITLVAPMDDGVYLSTSSEVFWLGGRDPAEWVLAHRSVHGAIPGTEAYHEADDVAEGQAGPVVLFATPRGIWAGFNGGSITNLTEDRFNYPIMDEGSGIIRHMGGSLQYILTLRGTERPGNTAF